MANAEEQVIALNSHIVGGISELSSEFNKLIGLALIFVEDGDIVSSSDQEESELVTGLTETDPSNLSFLVVLDDLSSIFFDPVRELYWLSVVHQLIPVVFGVFVLNASWNHWYIFFPVAVLVIYLWLSGGLSSHHFDAGSWLRSGMIDPTV